MVLGFAAADDATTKSHVDGAALSSTTLPQFPGDDLLAHAAAIYKESAEARFAAKGLLATAQGFDPPSVRCIKDIELADLPLLPEGHRDAERRKESRIKVIAQNAANEEKRYTLRLQAWTEVYTALKISTETTAPVLSRVLRDECDLSKQGVTGGYFDGPRAWAIVCAVLTGGLRSEVDKDYYRQAERLQRASPLADTVPWPRTTRNGPWRS